MGNIHKKFHTAENKISIKIVLSSLTFENSLERKVNCNSFSWRIKFWWQVEKKESEFKIICYVKKIELHDKFWNLLVTPR